MQFEELSDRVNFLPKPAVMSRNAPISVHISEVYCRTDGDSPQNIIINQKREPDGGDCSCQE